MYVSRKFSYSKNHGNTYRFKERIFGIVGMLLSFLLTVSPELGWGNGIYLILCYLDSLLNM